MSIWFEEMQGKNVKFSVAVERQLVRCENEYQKTEVYESVEFGKIIVRDDKIVFSDKDEFIYDEMLCHVPMAVNPHIRKILVIGGGDGGIIRELLKYKAVKNIDVVEDDEAFARICKEYFSETASLLNNKNIKTYYMSALRFLRGKEDEYDLIINDATDPYGYKEGLFTKEFYGACYHALKSDGILIFQHGSVFYSEEEMKSRKIHRNISANFPMNFVYQFTIPTSIAGGSLIGFASKKYHPLEDLCSKKWNDLGIKTEYYTTKLHRAAFILPRYIEKIMKEEE